MDKSIKDEIEKGISSAIPEIYHDGLQPATKVIGEGLVKTGKTLIDTVNALLIPLEGLVWGMNKIKAEVVKSVSKKLEGIDISEIKTPDPRIAGPILEGLRYTAQEDELRKLYENLLANSMIKGSSHRLHFSYPEIIKQLEPDEARILEYLFYHIRIKKINVRSEDKNPSFGGRDVIKNYSDISRLSNLENSGRYKVYLDNLERLKLIEISHDYWLKPDDLYNYFEEMPKFKKLKIDVESTGRIFRLKRGIIELTSFGIDFCHSCINKTSNAKSFTLLEDDKDESAFL
ncbi:MAG: DUF4393 domain-containing protein [Fusobacteriaceae bacterium]